MLPSEADKRLIFVEKLVDMVQDWTKDTSNITGTIKFTDGSKYVLSVEKFGDARKAKACGKIS